MTPTCIIVNCDRPAEGTAHDIGGTCEVCARCGWRFWGNFKPYPQPKPKPARP